MKKLIILLFFILLLIKVDQVQAGHDLTFACLENSSYCTVTPNGTPLFDDNINAPGNSLRQSITIINDRPDSCNLYYQARANLFSNTFLNNVLNLAITNRTLGSQLVFGNISHNQATTDRNLADFISLGNIYIQTIPAKTTYLYDWLITFDSSAGNEYQAKRTNFDLSIQVECDAILATLTPTPVRTVDNDDHDHHDGDHSDGGSDAPGCDKEAPASSPILFVESNGTNSVKLAWWPVNPVTHYALSFTRLSDGAEYGLTNLGNTTNFVVNNLQLNERYSFKVMGINDCAPGPWSNLVTFRITAGTTLATTTRPSTNSGQILGEKTIESTSSIDNLSASIDQLGTDNLNDNGQVAGITDNCLGYHQFLPWILLIVQAILIMLFEVILKKEDQKKKFIFLACFTLGSILLFYFLRDCQCVSGGILSFLCRWYFLVSIVETIILKLFAYLFIDENEANR